MQSRAKTVADYLAELTPERREAMSAVRTTLLAHLPDGYEETMLWGMIVYRVPEARFLMPGKKPLAYIALASHKSYMSLYLAEPCISEEGDDWFRDAYRASGKRLDAGKGCFRFRRVDDLPLEAVGRATSRRSVDDYVALMQVHDPR